MTVYQNSLRSERMVMVLRHIRSQHSLAEDVAICVYRVRFS